MRSQVRFLIVLFLIGGSSMVSFASTTYISPAYAQPAEEPRAFPFETPFHNLADLAVNPNTGKLYVVESADVDGTQTGLITVLNATSFEPIGNISESYYPSKIAFNTVTNTGYVLHSCNCSQGISVSIIDGETDTIIKTLNNVTSSLPINIQVNEFTNKIYVSDGRLLATIDGTTNTVLESRLISNATIGLMTINPGLNVIYGIGDDKTLVSIDLETNQLTYTNITIKGTSNPNAVDNLPVSMLVNPETNVLYVVNEALFPQPGPNEGISIPTAYLVAVNMTSSETISDNLAEIQSFYFDLEVNAATNVIYAVSGGNGILVLDGSTNQVIINYLFTIDPLTDFYPKAFTINLATDSLYLAAPNGIIVSPESYFVHEPPVAQGPEYKIVEGLYSNEELGFRFRLPDSMKGFVYEYNSSYGGKSLTLQVHPEFDPTDTSCCPPIDITSAVLLLDSGSLDSLTSPILFTNDLYAAIQGYHMRMSIGELDGKQVMVSTLTSERNDIPGYDTVRRVGKFYLMNNGERFVSYGLWASEENYQKYLGVFEESAKTMMIEDAGPVALRAIFQQYVPPNMELRLVDGSILHPEIITPSIIESVVLDEDENAVKINITEANGNSFLIANSGDLVVRPNSITLDGQLVDTVTLSNENGMYQVAYYNQTGNHDISITGTAIVPEFGQNSIAILGAISLVAALVGLRFHPRFVRK